MSQNINGSKASGSQAAESTSPSYVAVNNEGEEAPNASKIPETLVSPTNVKSSIPAVDQGANDNEEHHTNKAEELKRSQEPSIAEKVAETADNAESEVEKKPRKAPARKAAAKKPAAKKGKAAKSGQKLSDVEKDLLAESSSELSGVDDNIVNSNGKRARPKKDGADDEPQPKKTRSRAGSAKPAGKVNNTSTTKKGGKATKTTSAAGTKRKRNNDEGEETEAEVKRTCSTRSKSVEATKSGPSKTAAPKGKKAANGSKVNADATVKAEQGESEIVEDAVRDTAKGKTAAKSTSKTTKKPAPEAAPTKGATKRKRSEDGEGSDAEIVGAKRARIKMSPQEQVGNLRRVKTQIKETMDSMDELYDDKSFYQEEKDYYKGPAVDALKNGSCKDPEQFEDSMLALADNNRWDAHKQWFDFSRELWKDLKGDISESVKGFEKRVSVPDGSMQSKTAFKNLLPAHVARVAAMHKARYHEGLGVIEEYSNKIIQLIRNEHDELVKVYGDDPAADTEKDGVMFKDAVAEAVDAVQQAHDDGRLAKRILFSGPHVRLDPKQM